jgi:hypothetical protein
VNELADFQKMNEIRARVDALVEDPATAEALKPWYRYMCKRPTFSDTTCRRSTGPTSRSSTRPTTAASSASPRTRRGRRGGVRGRLRHLRHRVRGRRLGHPVRRNSRVRPGRRHLLGSLGGGAEDAARLLQPRLPEPVPARLAAERQRRELRPHPRRTGRPRRRSVVAEARKRRARYVEPTAEAEDAWVATIREKARTSTSSRPSARPATTTTRASPGSAASRTATDPSRSTNCSGAGARTAA